MANTRYTLDVTKRSNKSATTAEPEMNVVHMDRAGIRKVLGDLEAEIMEVMWAWPESKGATVREVHEVLQRRRQIAYTTVMNTMTRLAKKRYLHAETGEVAYVYHPAHTQAQFIDKLVDRIVNDLVVNFSGETVRTLSQSSDQDTAQRAQALLDEIERRKKAKRAGGQS
jgi:predicted transcriptional regulator